MKKITRTIKVTVVDVKVFDKKEAVVKEGTVSLYDTKDVAKELKKVYEDNPVFSLCDYSVREEKDVLFECDVEAFIAIASAKEEK